MHSERAVVVFSGGMDSGTLLAQVLHEGNYDEVHALSMFYGQRHEKELTYAMQYCEREGVPHRIVNLQGLQGILKGSALTDNVDVPEGHYEDESMRATVVPNRNAILISVAAGFAMSIKARDLYVGVHAGDHAIYPDCRPVFIDRMRDLLHVSGYDMVQLNAPFINMSKGDIARVGRELGLDYGAFWTCYKGGEKPCGKCGACQERLEAMQQSGAFDSSVYEV